MTIHRCFLTKALLVCLFLSLAVFPHADQEAGAAADPLTPEERAFVVTHGPIRYAPDPLFPPFEFLDSSGAARGITPDLLTVMGRKLGVEFRTVAYSKWSDVLEAAKRGKVDLLGTLTRTPEREGFLLFSSPYLSVPYVLFTRQDGGDLKTIDDMGSRRLGVVKNYGINTWLSAEHPNIRPVVVEDTATGLTMVATGQLDALLETLPVGAQIIRDKSLTNIRIVPRHIYTLPQHFGVRKEEPLLLSVVQKGLDSLTETERTETFVRWTGQDFSRPPPAMSRLLRNALIGLVAVAALCGVWVAILRLQVRQATRSLRERQREIKDRNEAMELAATGADLGLWDWDIASDRFVIGDNFGNSLGYAPGEIGPSLENWLKIVHPDDLPKITADLISHLKGETPLYEAEHRILSRSGEWRWCFIRGKVVERDPEGRALRAVGTSINITEKKVSEETIRQTEKQHRLILDNLKVVVFRSDTEGRWSFLNPAWTDLTGFDVRESIGKSYLEYVFPDDRERNMELVRQLIEREKDSCHHEVRYLRKNGGFRWVDAWAQLELDEQGDTTGITGTLTDITDRREGAVALQQSERRFRGLLEDVALIGVMLDREGNITFCNRSLLALTGWSPEEVLQQNWFDLFLPEEVREDVKNVFRTNLNDAGGYRSYENPIVTKSGEQRLISWTNTALRDNQGNVVGVAAVGNDVTEHKRAEQAVLAERNFSNAALESLPGIFYLFDQTGRFLRWNTNFELVSEYSQEEISGMSPLDFFADSDKTLINERIREVFVKGESNAEAALVSKSGKKIFCYFTGRIIHVEGKACLIGTGTDITDLKVAEEEKEKLRNQLQQAMKMEAIGRLAGGVAHDFNNLLTAIMGNISLSLMKLSPSDPATGLLAEAKRAAEGAATLTQQLLAFSRKQIIEPKVLDLNDLITGLYTMLTRLIGEHIDMKTVHGEDLGPVKVDPGQFEQILVNLAVNARDAMPDGGALLVETANVDLDEEYCARHPYVRPGRFVMLAVSDTGYGMTEEVRKNIFEPFFTTKPKGRGTGLGLATIYGVVKQSNGSIEVYSEVGKGTTFRIYLPRVEGEATKPREPDLPVELPTGSETVLLVEDEESVRNLCVRILERLGYRAMQAGNGNEAIALAREHVKRIDLLMTDVVMPGMNGRELANRLTRIHPEMKVLFTSGYTDNAIVRQGVLDEGVSFIGKPYTPLALARKVREVIDRA